jgi:hypothetical protein
VTLIHVRTLARAVFYPLLALIVGLGLGFAAYPQVVGHKLWLLSWAYTAIFNPPTYNAEAVTWIARQRLIKWYEEVPGFRILDWREFGEEARDFLIEFIDAAGNKVVKKKRVWVRWKLWTQNNGEDIIYGADPTMSDDLKVSVEDVAEDSERLRVSLKWLGGEIER